MFAIGNGLALHGGFIPYVGTFLTFSDYARNALRMAALMKLRHVFVFTHDSIGLGEDGPTHQSVEHASSLRLIPQHRRLAAVRHRRDRRWRGRQAIERADGPSACSSRGRTCAFAPRDAGAIAGIRARRLRARRLRRRGRGARGDPRHRLRSRRSRCGARRRSRPEGIAVRVVSMPCTQRVRSPGRRAIARRCCRPAFRASPSRPASPISGASTSARVDDPTRRRRRHRHASANPRRPAALFKHFGFTADNVAAAVQGVVTAS